MDNIPIVPIVGGLIVLAVLGWRISRMTRGGRLRLEFLWVRPVILMALAGAAMAQSPPSPTGWLWMAAALVIGAVPGWYRAGTVAITVDPKTHVLNQQASPIGIVIIVGLIAVRVGLRFLAVQHVSVFGLDPVLLADVAIAFLVGMTIAERIEMFLRASRLLAEARAKGAPSA